MVAVDEGKVMEVAEAMGRVAHGKAWVLARCRERGMRH